MDSRADNSVPGRVVYVTDIAPFAKKDCKICFGNGYIETILIKNGVESKNTVPCRCASRRFNKMHGKSIEAVAGQLRWKPNVKAPAV